MAEPARPVALVPRGDAAYYMLSLAAVQGSSFFIQLLVAAALAPADFAVVRTVEAWLSPLLIVAGVGLPSLAMAWIPRHVGAARGALARRLMGVSLVAGVTVASATVVAAPLWFAPPVGRYLALASALLVIVALARTLTNVLLAAERVRTTAIATAAVSLIAIPLAALGARRYGLDGWLAARYIAEGGVLLVVLWVARRWLAKGPEVLLERPGAILRTGAVLSGSMLVRSVADNLGPISAARLGFEGVAIGGYALATVAVSAVLLAPGAIGNLAIRRFAVTAEDPQYLRVAIRQGVVTMLLLSVVPCVVFAIAGEAILRTFFPAYQGTATLMSVVMWGAPWRALTALMGGVLVARQQARAILQLNVTSLLVAIALQWPLITRWGLWGSAWAVLGTDVLTALACIFVVRNQVVRLGRA